MIVGIYQILRHPKIHERVNKELLSAFPDVHEEITYHKIKQPPYLVR